MARYDFRCPGGHVTELVQPMSDPLPATIPCGGLDRMTGVMAMTLPKTRVDAFFGRPDVRAIEDLDCYEAPCQHEAGRIFEAPAAIHFKGRGFYATDVKGLAERRRRPNPGDSLPRKHDPDAAAVVRSR